jgi:hypothetical protein
LEFLRAALKNHPDIQGIHINNSEYLISQYADDSTIILENDEKSLNATLGLLNYFSDCSGLRTNFDKTEAIWIGAKRSCVETIKTIKNIRWNFDGQFKVLGIKYDLNKAEFWADNFKEKIITIKKLLGNWALRNLSLL